MSLQDLSKNKNGLTVIELIITVGIFSVIALLSTAFYSRFLLQKTAFNVQNQIVGSLTKAQLYSMMSRENSSWGVNYSSNKLTLFKGATYASRTVSFDETFDINSNISITGLTEVTFARITGLPTVTPTITVTGSNNTETITINSQGVVSR